MTRPIDWNLTIDDLLKEISEGKRKDCGQQEYEWAREYERSLIPSNYRYPLIGDLYESKFDQIQEFITNWLVPYTGGGESMLYKGERIWIAYESDEDQPLAVDALPVDYKKLELRMVDTNVRELQEYSCFHFCIDTKDLNEKFILIQTGYCKGKHT
jgi:hypothetical protein